MRSCSTACSVRRPRCPLPRACARPRAPTRSQRSCRISTRRARSRAIARRGSSPIFAAATPACRSSPCRGATRRRRHWRISPPWAARCWARRESLFSGGSLHARVRALGFPLIGEVHDGPIRRNRNDAAGQAPHAERAARHRAHGLWWRQGQGCRLDGEGVRQHERPKEGQGSRGELQEHEGESRQGGGRGADQGSREAHDSSVTAARRRRDGLRRRRQGARRVRSEEHTSELQSQSNLVCRLLLEKKKKKKKKKIKREKKKKKKNKKKKKKIKTKMKKK